MTAQDWREEPIDKRHDRKAFDCGDEDLNGFLQRHARQSHDAGGAKTFLAIDTVGGGVLAYYSLAPASVSYDRTPSAVRRGLARHDIPAFRLARLALDLRMQGAGLGGQLLLAAGKRCIRAAAEVGGVALIIDAKSERAARWYAGFGAMPFLDPPDAPPISLILPLATMVEALRSAGKL